MTHPTPDPLREALEQIARAKYGLQGLLEDGESDEAITRYWADLAHSYERIARAALAAAPQPAPAPAADERDEIERIICDAFTCDLRGRGDEDGAFWQTAADALLAAGYRKADGLADERETLAWAVVGGRRPIDSSDIFMREEDAKLYRGKGERIVRVAIRIVEGGA